MCGGNSVKPLIKIIIIILSCLTLQTSKERNQNENKLFLVLLGTSLEPPKRHWGSPDPTLGTTALLIHALQCSDLGQTNTNEP